jgi:hypothetical protein
MQNEEIRRLGERLDGLERQNRRLKWLLLLMPLFFLAMGAAARLAEDTVIARRVVITDGERNRIALGVNDAGHTFINVWDKGGKWIKALGEEQP